MKERPILFSAPMVRALLAGNKTQTRRVATPKRSIEPMTDECPYGEPGDRLWVREAFRFTDGLDALSPAQVGLACCDAGYSKPWAPLQYEADGETRNWMNVGTPTGSSGPPQAGKLRPGMFMPRWASRITLKVSGVRVERLQNISEADALAEGVWTGTPDALAAGARGVQLNHVGAYASLWEQINGPGAWEANPWVWAITFARLP